MHIFVETERLVLRRFTENDADILVELDGDPEVMYFITGGRQTPRREIESEFLPAYLEYYERYAGFEGSCALIEKGFADLGVERVFATTMVVNVASRRVLEKSGLRYVRTFHQPWPYPIEGDEHGDVEYGLLRSEWEAA